MHERYRPETFTVSFAGGVSGMHSCVDARSAQDLRIAKSVLRDAACSAIPTIFILRWNQPSLM